MLGMRDVTSYSNDILLYFVINMVINLSVLIGLRKKNNSYKQSLYELS